MSHEVRSRVGYNPSSWLRRGRKRPQGCADWSQMSLTSSFLLQGLSPELPWNREGQATRQAVPPLASVGTDGVSVKLRQRFPWGFAGLPVGSTVSPVPRNTSCFGPALRVSFCIWNIWSYDPQVSLWIRVLVCDILNKQNGNLVLLCIINNEWLVRLNVFIRHCFVRIQLVLTASLRCSYFFLFY